jgi:DNA-binding transcriptional ArsR family regulator
VIADSFPSAWATVSRHLAVLREADLVVAERDGQAIRYELNTSVFQDVVRHLADTADEMRGKRRAGGWRETASHCSQSDPRAVSA